jgi:two-component sensor histidine kinase
VVARIARAVDDGGLGVGGPPVSPPTHKGFGSRMIEHAIRGEQGASAFHFQPEGLSCTIEIPI